MQVNLFSAEEGSLTFASSSLPCSTSSTTTTTCPSAHLFKAHSSSSLESQLLEDSSDVSNFLRLSSGGLRENNNLLCKDIFTFTTTTTNAHSELDHHLIMCRCRTYDTVFLC